MSRRDGKARMPWSVKGVSPEARELAKSATAREGDTMGDWLSDVIRRVGAAQAAGRPVGGSSHRRGLPAFAGRRPFGGEARSLAVRTDPQPAETVDEEALTALIAERVERSETRLVGLLQSLEEIVARLADRLDRLEQAADRQQDDHHEPTPRRSLPRS